MSQPKTCPCGEEFSATHHFQRYCPPCRKTREGEEQERAAAAKERLAKVGTPPPKTCKACAKEFTPSDSREVCCSVECKRLRKNEIERNRKKAKRKGRVSKTTVRVESAAPVKAKANGHVGLGVLLRAGAGRWLVRQAERALRAAKAIEGGK